MYRFDSQSFPAYPLEWIIDYQPSDSLSNTYFIDLVMPQAEYRPQCIKLFVQYKQQELLTNWKCIGTIYFSPSCKDQFVFQKQIQILEANVVLHQVKLILHEPEENPKNLAKKCRVNQLLIYSKSKTIMPQSVSLQDAEMNQKELQLLQEYKKAIHAEIWEEFWKPFWKYKQKLVADQNYTLLQELQSLQKEIIKIGTNIKVWYHQLQTTNESLMNHSVQRTICQEKFTLLQLFRHFRLENLLGKKTVFSIQRELQQMEYKEKMHLHSTTEKEIVQQMNHLQKLNSELEINLFDHESEFFENIAPPTKQQRWTNFFGTQFLQHFELYIEKASLVKKRQLETIELQSTIFSLDALHQVFETQFQFILQMNHTKQLHISNYISVEEYLFKWLHCLEHVVANCILVIPKEETQNDYCNLCKRALYHFGQSLQLGICFVSFDFLERFVVTKLLGTVLPLLFYYNETNAQQQIVWKQFHGAQSVYRSCNDIIQCLLNAQPTIRKNSIAFLTKQTRDEFHRDSITFFIFRSFVVTHLLLEEQDKNVWIEQHICDDLVRLISGTKEETIAIAVVRHACHYMKQCVTLEWLFLRLEAKIELIAAQIKLVTKYQYILENRNLLEMQWDQSCSLLT